MMVKQERAARTRQALIRAAAEAFAGEGFTLASLTTISRTAGVSNGALHFHFESKAVLADAVEDAAAVAVARIVESAEASDDPLQALVDATYGLLGLIADDVVVRAGFGLCGDPARGRGDAGLRQQWQHWVERQLERAEREGKLADGTSHEQVAPIVVAATVGFEVLGSWNPEWLDRSRIDRFWELLLPRLAGRAEAASSGPEGRSV
ncbi:ScbR family autoregulator-binding transcription factor [Streptomyces sp. NBC_01465]|uniref:ScbR family autoregulator-binding transcription factor n=1 Tax=Streptomyces sp. NBC_01465 TaxID=2903878 RepID=UPI002E305EB3|nr:ScbR family autoregulator-binding transcription factor [Streptomyces sp. NBC_01465]